MRGCCLSRPVGVSKHLGKTASIMHQRLAVVPICTHAHLFILRVYASLHAAPSQASLKCPCVATDLCCFCILHTQAQRHADAASLLLDTAEQLAVRQAPPLQIKKLYVLAALEMELLRKQAASSDSDKVRTGAAHQAGSEAAGGPVLTRGKHNLGAAGTLTGEVIHQALAGQPKFASANCPHLFCILWHHACASSASPCLAMPGVALLCSKSESHVPVWLAAQTCWRLRLSPAASA